MKISCIIYTAVLLSILVMADAVFCEAPETGVGIVIGRVEVRIEEVEGELSTELGGIDVEIVREETVRGEEVRESIEARTTDTGVFMATIDNMDGGFRIAKLKLTSSGDWIDVARVSVKGDVRRYGPAYFRRFGRVIVLNPLIYEEEYDGRSRFIMVISPFADICLNFLGSFPLSPWKTAVEQARSMSIKAEKAGDSVAGRERPSPEKKLAEVKDRAGPTPTRRPVRRVKAMLAEEEEEEATGSGIPIIIVTSIVLVILAILVGLGGRRRPRSHEREIDIHEIEQIETERKIQRTAKKEEKEEKEEEEEGEDLTSVLSDREGWFLREFRRARVRIHWKKYDSAAVSLEKTTRFMEEQIDRLEEKKEIYTLVLHYSYLGRCYLESGRYNDALRVFKRGVELNEYNSRMCEMGLADTLDGIARIEDSPCAETLSAKYPLLSGGEIESIVTMAGTADS
ncbi:MAG: tetratricopeptide repeat protein [Candidatus Tritonobacter lacicola]|nr:tetratricopeptide repeat protein [Candidatus Tritonobacter lacicola]